jgi:hypothetical protein
MKATILLLLAGLSTVQAAEPTGTLTLACEGSSRATEQTLSTVSFGVIVDFANRTVQGLPSKGAVKVTTVDETSINFEGWDTDLKSGIVGEIDRVTGDLTALDTLGDLKTFYSLKCNPTQRMFLGERLKPEGPH